MEAGRAADGWLIHGCSLAAMSTPDAAFYFDLASPLAYLAAERVLHTMPVATEWQPVLARELPGARVLCGVSLSRRAGHLPPGAGAARQRAWACSELRWPEPFPFDSAFAMRAATYAKSIGRIVAFAQAAFRQAYRRRTTARRAPTTC